MPVPQVLDLHKRQALVKADRERTLLERQTCPAKPRRRGIAATDREIDRLVYGLYGLAEDEIKIVEQSGGK